MKTDHPDLSPKQRKEELELKAFYESEILPKIEALPFEELNSGQKKTLKNSFMYASYLRRKAISEFSFELKKAFEPIINHMKDSFPASFKTNETKPQNMMSEEYCQCRRPKKDQAYSICLKCHKQLKKPRKKFQVEVVSSAECDLKKDIENNLNLGFTLAAVSFTGAYLDYPAGTFREAKLFFVKKKQ